MSDDRTKDALSAWFWVALALHALAGFFYALSGLLAPPYGVAFLALIWLSLLWWLIRLRKEGLRALLAPAAAMALWFLVMFLGDQLLGWTA